MLVCYKFLYGYNTIERKNRIICCLLFMLGQIKAFWYMNVFSDCHTPSPSDNSCNLYLLFKQKVWNNWTHMIFNTKDKCKLDLIYLKINI